MKILQINTAVNSGSTGRIAEDIGRTLISKGHESYIAFGRGNQKSNSKLIKIGNKLDFYLAASYTDTNYQREGLFDNEANTGNSFGKGEKITFQV